MADYISQQYGLNPQQGQGGLGYPQSGNPVLMEQYASNGMPDYQTNNDYLQKLLNGKTPFASNQWDDLISQLQMRASGQGPSLAQMNYQKANQDTTANLSSMAAASSNPGAAREAMIQQGRAGQGLAQGLVQGGLQEQQNAQEGLMKALGSRDQLNQNAVMSMLAQKLGLNKDQFNAVMNRQMMSNQQDAQTAQAAASTMAMLAMIAA